LTAAELADRLFRGRRAVLLTKHGKEQAIQPVFEAGTGCELVVRADFDTDQFGTFTREVPRPGSQLDAARAKARKGMELTGLDLGLASEGTFGPHPALPFLPWNLEVVLLLDDRLGLELHGEYAGENTNYAHALVSGWDEAEEFARGAGFPAHALVVRPDHDAHPAIRKGIDGWDQLRDALTSALAASETGRAFLETDMRAHVNPTRMGNIRAATEDLVRKLLSPCPACGQPGFAPIRRVAGLPCELCGEPTPLVASVVYGCRKCSFTREEPVPNRTAPPDSCPCCNP
jgi:hypothetical protein